MIGYIIRRMMWMVLTIFVVSLLMFIMIFSAPVDPAKALVGEKSMGVSIEKVREKYGLDQPFYIQWANYMSGLVRLDLGESYYFRRPVSEALFAHFPATAKLALSIMLTSLVIGIPLGVLMAIRANGAVDKAMMVLGTLTISIPSFLFGLILIYLFAFQIKIFPAGGHGKLEHIVLPTLTIAIPWAVWYAIVLRSNMLEVVNSDWARTARAKGLKEWIVSRRHLLPNAILPLVTMLGMDLAGLLGGLALVEYVFSWPGMGWQALNAARRFDIPMVMGSVLFGAVLTGFGNLSVDLIYRVIDPRVRVNA